MQTLTLTDTDMQSGFESARAQAVRKARETLDQPLIVAWRDATARRFAPAIPGASEQRWHVYGERNNGMLQIDVAEAYSFIFTESSGFEAPDLNVETLRVDGDSGILCLRDACTERDLRALGHFAGGGIGG